MRVDGARRVPDTANVRFAFGPFVIDTEDETLLRDGGRVALRGKSFAVLRVLVQHAGKLTSREQLLDEVWGETIIHEQGLSVCVREIRAALGDDPRTPAFVKTEHGRGYRLLVPARKLSNATRDTVTNDERAMAHSTRVVTFLWSAGEPAAHETALIDAALEIGRGPLGDFTLNDRTVSRRHARVSCVNDAWRVEDLGSHNGTWLDGTPLVSAAAPAREGAVVRLGETVLVLGEASAALRSRATKLATANHEVRASSVERALLGR